MSDFHDLPHTLMTDDALLSAYHRTSEESGDPEVEALLAEIARRNLDI